MPVISESALMVAAGGIAAAVFAVFLGLLVWERDPARAAEKTSEKFWGTVLGASSVGLYAIVEGVHVVAEAPGLVMGLLGIGWVFAGINLEVAAATGLTMYILLAAVRGDQ